MAHLVIDGDRREFRLGGYPAVCCRETSRKNIRKVSKELPSNLTARIDGSRLSSWYGIA